MTSNVNDAKKPTPKPAEKNGEKGKPPWLNKKKG